MADFTAQTNHRLAPPGLRRLLSGFYLASIWLLSGFYLASIWEKRAE